MNTPKLYWLYSLIRTYLDMVDESDMDDDQEEPLESVISASLEDHNQDERWEQE